MTTVPSPTLFAVPRPTVSALPWEPFTGSPGVSHKVLYTTGRTVAGLLKLAPGAEEISHVHMEGEHHIWVLAGAVVVDDTELVAESYLHVPERLTHAVRDGGTGSLLFYVFTPAS
jgi:quercetin dioxygenase-like cupin family protein